MINKVRILVLLLVFPYLSVAQTTINAEQFFDRGFSLLGTATKLESKNVRFPWIEEYELRSETRDFDFDQQEYTFRISPSTVKKRQAQKALAEHFDNVPDFEYQEMLCKHTLSLHLDWLSLYLITENNRILTALSQVLTDKQVVYEKMAGAYDFDFQELVKLQIAKSDLAIAMHELQLDQNYIENKYGLINPQFEFQDFVTMDQIYQVLTEETTLSNLNIDPEFAYEKELVARELALEKSEARQFFDFAQVRYQGPHSDMIQERLSLGIGLRIPQSGNRKLKIKELQLKQKEFAREEQRDAQALQEEFNALRQKLLIDIQSYEFYMATIAEERIQLKNLGTKIAQKEGFNPLLLLDIEKRHLNTQLKALELQEDIFLDYLRYLEQSGQLCQQPRVNYLRLN